MNTAQAHADHPDREPPHSVEAEKGVLSSIILWSTAAIAECVAGGVQACWFYVPTHRTIYVELRDMYDSGDAIDLITFTQRLRDKGLLAEVGGPYAVTDLQLYLDQISNFHPTIENLPDHIGILRDLYVRRQIIANAAKDTRRAYDPDPCADICTMLDEISSRAVSLRSLHGPNGKIEFTVRPATEIITLKLDPNDCLCGDRLLSKGGQMVVAGPAGIGKSRWLLQLAAVSIIGRDHCGIETHAKGLRWLILQTENSNRRLQHDLRALEREFGKSFLDSLFIHTVETDIDGFVSLDDPIASRRLQEAIRKIQPAIIACDPLAAFAIGNIDTDTDMRLTCTALGRLCRTGDPQRAIVPVHHALTGKAGAVKATGWERSSFGRNSKNLIAWARSQINIAAKSPDNNEKLVIACGKNNDGKEFSTFAAELNLETMIYKPLDNFDVDEWREQLTLSGNKKQTFTLEMVREQVKFSGQLEIGPLAKKIADKIGCSRARSYELVHEARKARIFRFNKITETYARI